MSVSAIVVCHENRAQLDHMLGQLKLQTQPPDEIIVVACCTDLTGVVADIVVQDIHRGDWGHLGRDIGLRLATKDKLGFFNCDDDYDPRFIEQLAQESEDLVYCDFKSHTAGRVIESHPSLGSITSGNFLIRTSIAQQVGWIHRDYLGDGKFILDITATGASHKRVAEVLYIHC